MSAVLAELAWPRRVGELSLRPARPADAAELWTWYRLPEVTEWVSGRFPDPEAFAEFYAGRCANYLVADLDGRLVANLKLDVEDAWAQAEIPGSRHGREAEIGWAVDPAVQGRGLATRLARELLAIAFEELDVHRVTAVCFAANTASVRIMEKLGLRQEAHFVADSLHRSGRWLDSLVYAILADEWRAATLPT